MISVLTIAGSDSGGGAGIQADLKTFAANCVHGASVLTALTAQNTLGVHGVYTVPPDFIAKQLEAVLSDIPVRAVKTGMLGDEAAIRVVAGILKKYRIDNIVVDPVMVAQSGDRLLPEKDVNVLREMMIPLSSVFTPNIPEAEVLLSRPVSSVPDMEKAARSLQRMGAGSVLVKGGHLTGEEMTDVFFDGSQLLHLSGKRINTQNTHGTGCTYAAAIAALLARGFEPPQAVRTAKEFVTAAIMYGSPVGKGYGPVNPTGLLCRKSSQKQEN